MSMKNELLFDLIETEADLNVFLHREGFTAEKAAIIVTSSSLGHFPKQRGDKYTLWFGGGIVRETFKKESDAFDRVIEIIGTSNRPIDPTFEGRRVKQFIRKWNDRRQ